MLVRDDWGRNPAQAAAATAAAEARAKAPVSRDAFKAKISSLFFIPMGSLRELKLDPVMCRP